jgi:Ca2+-transporting ATPase
MMEKGLTDEEVNRLRLEFGYNIIPSRERVSALDILISQFKNPLIFILIASGLISFFFKQYLDVILIAVVILVDAAMGFYQEYHAKKTLLALKKILVPDILALRNGQRVRIKTQDLVPQDLVILKSGDKIPADGTLISDTSLLVNEAILTGEEEAVSKTKQEKENALFMGTVVLSGSGIMKVEKTGDRTEMGKIGKSLEEIRDEKTPLQIKLGNLSYDLAKIILAICFFIFLLGVFGDKQNVILMLRTAIVLSVAAIPEGLPIAITVIMVLGMSRVLKKQGLVRKLLAIEALGSTSVVCTDKTGTLTEGLMQVVKYRYQDRDFFSLALSLTNEQKSAVEVALWEFLKNRMNQDPQKMFDTHLRVYEEPFDSEKKYSLTINQVNDKKMAFVLGAPEILLSFSEMEQTGKNQILAEIESWADEGLKVLGVAFKEQGDLRSTDHFSWLGLVGLADPLRKEAKETIANFQKAGIKVKIITGDYLRTAIRVTQNLGFEVKKENVLEGRELEIISDEELKKRIENILIFARVSPHQKLKIVKALQENNEVVAMTGDGVNDAPALKKADIGVVVKDSSDVAKEASDLVLLDNNLKTIIFAVEEGRLVFSNLKKVVGYILSNSFAEIFLILGAMILKIPTPLTVIQILWIHLICDGPPDILLSFEPKEKTLMTESPQAIKKEEVLSKSMVLLIGAISLTIGFLSLVLFCFYLSLNQNLALAQTMAFAALASVDLIYIFSFKNLKEPLIKTGNIFKNPYLFLGIAYGFILLFAAIYLPGLNKILGTVPLKEQHWLIIFSFGLTITLFLETIKFFKPRQG